ncbi:MAG: lytic murein transglycosylase, partial [Solirubrobacteraceae bacterium]
MPTQSNPTFSLSLPGPAAIGVPNFFIDSFRIPPFLIPIYQAAGIEYQVPWQVLAGINEIETDYGRNLSVSTAGAVGWMQFLPSTWKMWGVDANGDGVADPYNPVDAIFTAARYLHAAGASSNLGKAIFAYNHATWYVQSVLLRAQLIGGIPSQLVGALTGLVQGHFPVAAPAKYADSGVVAMANRKVTRGNAAMAIDSNPSSRGTSIFAKRGSPVIAVNDGRIVKLGQNAQLGRYVELQDSTGNIYTYAHLGSVARQYPVPKPVKMSARQIVKEFSVPAAKAPTGSASAGSQVASPTVAPALATAATKAPKASKGAIAPASA